MCCADRRGFDVCTQVAVWLPYPREERRSAVSTSFSLVYFVKRCCESVIHIHSTVPESIDQDIAMSLVAVFTGIAVGVSVEAMDTTVQERLVFCVPKCSDVTFCMFRCFSASSRCRRDAWPYSSSASVTSFAQYPRSASVGPLRRAPPLTTMCLNSSWRTCAVKISLHSAQLALHYVPSPHAPTSACASRCFRTSELRLPL